MDTRNVLAFGVGDPTWGHALLLMLAIVAIGVGVAWLLARKRL